jgi:hypothetical protein
VVVVVVVEEEEEEEEEAYIYKQGLEARDFEDSAEDTAATN